MNESKYRVERTIEDVVVEEETVEEVQKRVRKEMIDEGQTTLDEDEVEKRVQEELLELAVDRTLYSQGDNRLHNEVTHDLVVEE